MPKTRKERRLFLTWYFASMLFTKAKLLKFHLQLFHPNSTKSINSVMRAHPGQDDEDRKKRLEKVMCNVKPVNDL